MGVGGSLRPEMVRDWKYREDFGFASVNGVWEED
jgi:hypothetical protein